MSTVNPETHLMYTHYGDDPDGGRLTCGQNRYPSTPVTVTPEDADCPDCQEELTRRHGDSWLSGVALHTNSGLRELLEKARSYLDTEDRWCQGVIAKDAWGLEAHLFSEDVVAVCAAGALIRAVKRLYPHAEPPVDGKLLSAAGEFLTDAVGASGLADDWLSEWNDDPHTTHQMVLQMYDTAIELAQEAFVHAITDAEDV